MLGGVSASLTSRNESPPVRCGVVHSLQNTQAVPKPQICHPTWKGLGTNTACRLSRWMRGEPRALCVAAGSQESFCLESVARAKGLCCRSVVLGQALFLQRGPGFPWLALPGCRLTLGTCMLCKTGCTAAWLAKSRTRWFSKSTWDHSPPSASTDFTTSSSSCLKCHWVFLQFNVLIRLICSERLQQWLTVIWESLLPVPTWTHAANKVHYFHYTLLFLLLSALPAAWQLPMFPFRKTCSPPSTDGRREGYWRRQGLGEYPFANFLLARQHMTIKVSFHFTAALLCTWNPCMAGKDFQGESCAISPRHFERWLKSNGDGAVWTDVPQVPSPACSQHQLPAGWNSPQP